MSYRSPLIAAPLAWLLTLVPPVQAISDQINVEHGKLNTADASPVDSGHFEVEPSFVSSRAERFFDGSGHRHGRPLSREKNLGLSLTAGIVDKVDMNISGGYSWLKDDANDYDGDGDLAGPFRGDDFTDLKLSGRYRFLHDPTRGMEIAYIGGVTIPTGNRSDQDEIGTSQEFYSINQVLVATKDWDRWTLNGDIGFALPVGNKRGKDRGTFSTDLALGCQVLDWLQPEVELNYGHDFLASDDDSTSLAITAGLVMPIRESLRINLGIQQTFWGENTDKSTTLITAVKFAF